MLLWVLAAIAIGGFVIALIWCFPSLGFVLTGGSLAYVIDEPGDRWILELVFAAVPLVIALVALVARHRRRRVPIPTAYVASPAMLAAISSYSVRLPAARRRRTQTPAGNGALQKSV